MKNTAHVWRIFGLIAVAAITGLVLQRVLRPAGFGELGHYRAGALDEIQSQVPRYQGEAACAECHKDIVELHDKDVHQGVQCEDCHGAGDVHTTFHREHPDPGSPAGPEARMPKEYTLEGCLFCHRKLAARPRDFPQVNPAEHYRFLHVSAPETRCVECHSPHEPLFLLTRIADARIHPVIYECEDCHDKRPEGDQRQVPKHPAIFVCGDCHPAIVKDFADREHAFLRCTACHLFYRENETAGRIFKNGNRRFCLLCHEQKPFKAEGELPMIVGAKHIPDMAQTVGKDAAALERDPKACLECHFEYVHGEDVVPRKEGSNGG